MRARVADCGPAEVRQGLAATQLTAYLMPGETADSQVSSGFGFGFGFGFGLGFGLGFEFGFGFGLGLGLGLGLGFG